MKNREVQNYWIASGIVIQLNNALRILEVQSRLDNLLCDRDNTIEIKFMKNV